MSELVVCGGTGVYIDPPASPSPECDCEQINRDIATLKTEAQRLETDKQDVLEAGENITIEGNRISATGGGQTYTAGDHILIQNNVISADLTSYYTKTEVNDLIDAIENARIEVVQTLPQTGETNVLYFVPNQSGTGYDEYAYINNDWELIGTTDIDLSQYYTKTETDNLLADKQDTLTAGSHINIASDGTISVTAPTKAELLAVLGYEEKVISITDANNVTTALTVLAAV